MSLIKNRAEVYSDFRRDFSINPVTRDLARITNEDAIKQACQNILLIDEDEVPFSSMGVGIRRYLFEALTPSTLTMIKDRIQYGLRRFEPRIEVSGVNVIAGEDEHTVHVVIYYYIQTSPNVNSIELSVSRLR